MNSRSYLSLRFASVAKVVMALTLAAAIGCMASEPPPLYEASTLRGSAYERGYAHGEKYASKIRSLYTQLLTSALLPNLNREQPDIGTILPKYVEDELYVDGRFSYQVLLDSALAFEEQMPEEFLEEIRGIANGSRLAYEEILILNTFVDSVLGVRTLQRYLGQHKAPYIAGVEIVSSASEGVMRQEPYESLAHAHFIDVPVDASIRIVLEDAPGVRASAPLDETSEPPEDDEHIGVDPGSVRIVLNDELFVQGDEGLVLEPLDERGVRLAAIISPPGGLPEASVVSIGIEAGNLVQVHEPPPTRSRIMRQQWVTMATEGLGRPAEDIPNIGLPDERFPPTPVAFAVRGRATADGALRVAHHVALLDAGTLHRHVVVFAHEPEDGIPYVVVGYAGLVGGFSGMNAEGLVWCVNHADTLDNPIVRNVPRTLGLISGGFPVTMLGREVLAKAADVETAIEILVGAGATAGWNHLVAGGDDFRLYEADGGNWGEGSGMDHVYGPDTRDARGRRLASWTDDDIRVSSHYVSNWTDTQAQLLDFELPPQRFWSPYWNRSLRAFHFLGERLEAQMGRLDSAAIIEILRDEELVDPRDSMNAVIYEPEALRLWLAAGTVPATDAPFELHEGAELWGRGR